ncbi:MAG: alkaline phosphatase PhoX, partial [Desulfococcaceae bacterium]
MSIFFQDFPKKRSLPSVLTIAAMICALALFAGCSDNDDDDFIAEEGGRSIRFSEIDVPVTDAEKRAVLASDKATVNGEEKEIGYQVMMRSGDMIGGAQFGLVLDRNGAPVVGNDGEPYISNSNDFSSLLPVGDKLFNLTHFESRPGAMYLTELNQDPATGMLTPVSTKNVDFSEWGGLWVPCAGSVTPWGTHLGSQEYPPDARTYAEAETPDDLPDYDKPMYRYFGIVDPFAESVTLEQIKAVFNPYAYGYPMEVEVFEDAGYKVTEHYAMGRVALELAYVMPDRKTAFLTDDGTNVALFMFIADEPGDLSTGRLYIAKWNQTSSENGGVANIEWMPMGHATHEEVAAAVDSGVTFDDIFATAAPADDFTCPVGYVSINTEPGHECLRVKEGMETIASRLETRRYGAMMGGTTEFRKMEGVTHDPDKNRIYVAMSEINAGMEDYRRRGEENDRYDRGGPNSIYLPYNNCGTVYSMDLGRDDAIGSDYVPMNMVGLVSGIMTEYPDDSPYANNSCDVDGIANPDNVTYLPGYNTLIIGEDTGSGHQNDVIWSFDTDTGEMTRIQSTPYGSETTSPYFYPNINGYAYIMSVIQHPYGESDRDKLADPSDAMAYVGYIGPL